MLGTGLGRSGLMQKGLAPPTEYWREAWSTRNFRGRGPREQPAAAAIGSAIRSADCGKVSAQVRAGLPRAGQVAPFTLVHRPGRTSRRRPARRRRADYRARIACGRGGPSRRSVPETCPSRQRSTAASSRSGVSYDPSAIWRRSSARRASRSASVWNFERRIGQGLGPALHSTARRGPAGKACQPAPGCGVPLATPRADCASAPRAARTTVTTSSAPARRCGIAPGCRGPAASRGRWPARP